MNRSIISLIILMACTSANASPPYSKLDLFTIAAGDTIKVTQFFKVANSPDSLVIVFSARNAASKTLRTSTLPNNTPLSLGPVFLIPSPVMLEGDTVTVAACPTLWKKNQSSIFSCQTKLFTRPIIPPTFTPDSLTVIGLKVLIDNNPIRMVVNSSHQICAAIKFKDGKYILRASDQLDTTQVGCNLLYLAIIPAPERLHNITMSPGRNYFFASKASPARQAIVDTMCFHWTTPNQGASVTPSTFDQNCALAGSSIRHPYYIENGSTQITGM